MGKTTKKEKSESRGKRSIKKRINETGHRAGKYKNDILYEVDNLQEDIDRMLVMDDEADYE